MDTIPQQRYQPLSRNHLKNSRLHRDLVRHQNKKPFPFLKLSLELRIMVYNHAISDQEVNITQPLQFKRSAALLHTNLQIMREIYQFFPINAVIDILIPLGGKFYSAFSGNERYFCYGHCGDKVLRSMIQANRVTKCWDVSCRKQLTIKVRVRCMDCGMVCKGLSGDEVCRKCEMFVRCEAWCSGTTTDQKLLTTEDRLFEFC